MMEKASVDVVVVGLGAVGAATLYQLSLKGAKVLGIDQFTPPHGLGSSHGETRITRLAVGEGEEYVALAKRSHELWDQIQVQSGKKIKTRTGGLLIDSAEVGWSKHGAEGFWERTLRYAQNQGIEHKLPAVDEIVSSYAALKLPAGSRVYHEMEAGYLFPEVAIQAQLDLAKKLGAGLWTETKVKGIIPQGETLVVDAGKVQITCKKLILSAGGWVKDFLPERQRQRLRICRQVLYWLEVDPSFTDWKQYPVWMWGFGPRPEDFLYGFPSLDGKTIKVATESFIEVDHPDELDREVSLEEMETFWETKIKGRILGLRKKVVQAVVCFYTVTEDGKFLIEEMHENPNFLWVSACSGHGFKHAAALGEVLAKKIGY
jgi:sarcosine oxidase